MTTPDGATAVPVVATGRTPSGDPVEVFEGGPRDPFSASRWSLAAGFTTSWDQHDATELWLVAAGAGTMSTGEVDLSIRPGDCIRIEGGTPHRVRNDGSEPLRMFSVWWTDSHAAR